MSDKDAEGPGLADPPNLVKSLALFPIATDTFRAKNTHGMGGPRLFGGQVIAQALMAAYETIDTRLCHSLHAYFVRAGSPLKSLDFVVERVREGSSFTVRRVAALQEGEQILNLAASFQVEEDGLTHQSEMPQVPEPETLPDAGFGPPVPAGSAAAPNEMLRPIEMRQVHPRSFTEPSVAPPHKAMWVRTRGLRGAPQRDHHVALAFASDMNVLETAMRPHGLIWSSPGFQSASLDHAVWFHRPFDFSDWHLFVQDSPNAFGARGFVRGQVFARNGTLVASVAQEGLMRLRKKA